MAARKVITEASNIIPITCHPKFSAKPSRLVEESISEDEIWQLAIGGRLRFEPVLMSEEEGAS